jgi:hypothetical protein
MKEQYSYNKEIGFADSNILSVNVIDGNVTVVLKRWNDQIIEIKFFNFIAMLSTDNTSVADFIEIFESPLLDYALEDSYESKPKMHPYRVFKFLTSDDTNSLEVVCEEIYIKHRS